MSLFKKSHKAQDDKKCFRCGKALKEGHYTKANRRYCCDKCCSSQGEAKEVCEFC